MNENDVYENQLDGSTWNKTPYVRGVDEAGNSVLLPVEGMGYETATIEDINSLFDN